MRNRWARGLVVGLIFVFPLMIAVVSARGHGGGFPRTLRASAPILAVETVLLGGLVFASRERRRLLVELDAARTRPSSVATPAPALAGLRASARRFVPGRAPR